MQNFKKRKPNPKPSLIESLEARGYNVITAGDLTIAIYGKSRMIFITEQPLHIESAYYFVDNLTKEDVINSKVI